MRKSVTKQKPEQVIQKEICHYLESKGYLFWRFSPETFNAKINSHIKHHFVPNGLPDIMLINKEEYGQLVGLEVKKTNGKKSPNQLLMQRRFHLNNAMYEFVTSVDDVKKLGL